MQILLSSLLLGCLSIYSLQYLGLFPDPFYCLLMLVSVFHVGSVSQMSGALRTSIHIGEGGTKQLFGSSMCFSVMWLGSEPAFSFWDPNVIVISLFAEDAHFYFSVEDSPGVLPEPGCLCSGSRCREGSWVYFVFSSLLHPQPLQCPPPLYPNVSRK